MPIFDTIINNMQNMGFFQYVFPFLLSLAILYGLMTWVLKDRMPKSAISLISLILSFFVMLFVSANPGIVGFLMNISGYWLIAGSGILFVMLLLGLVGVKTEEQFLKSEWGKWVLILFIIAIGLVIFFAAGGNLLVGTPSWSVSSEMWTIVFFVVILAVVLLMMGREGGSSGGGEKKD